MFEIPTPQAIDTTLASLDNDALIAIVDAAGRLPMAPWERMTAAQRQALRASNLLTKRAVAAERQAAAQQRQAASQIEAKLQAQLAGHAERERRENQELLEKKRKEMCY